MQYQTTLSKPPCQQEDWTKLFPLCSFRLLSIGPHTRDSLVHFAKRRSVRSLRILWTAASKIYYCCLGNITYVNHQLFTYKQPRLLNVICPDSLRGVPFLRNQSITILSPHTRQNRSDYDLRSRDLDTADWEGENRSKREWKRKRGRSKGWSGEWLSRDRRCYRHRSFQSVSTLSSHWYSFLRTSVKWT